MMTCYNEQVFSLMPSMMFQAEDSILRLSCPLTALCRMLFGSFNGSIPAFLSTLTNLMSLYVHCCSCAEAITIWVCSTHEVFGCCALCTTKFVATICWRQRSRFLNIVGVDEEMSHDAPWCSMSQEMVSESIFSYRQRYSMPQTMFTGCRAPHYPVQAIGRKRLHWKYSRRSIYSCKLGELVRAL